MAALTINQLFPEGVSNLGAVDGSCTGVISGGKIPYTVSSDGVTYFPETTTVENLAPGNYTFYVKDDVGAIATAPFYIPTYPQITDEVVTPESGVGIHDGSIRFNLSGGLSPYFYSIDSVNYNRSDGNPVIITGLAHGSYTLLVYDNQNVPIHLITAFTIKPFQATYGCTDPQASNYNPLAQTNDGTCIYPDVSENAPGVSNLYADPDEFRIILQNQTVYRIAEPKDWDKMNVAFTRDPDYHGVNYMFSEGDIKLKFDDVAGRRQIQSEYDTYGNDALTRFQFGLTNEKGFVVYFDAFIDYNSFEKQENFVIVGVKRKTFNDLLETRAETIVNVNNVLPLPLYSKLIQMQTTVNEGSVTGAVAQLPKNSWPDHVIGAAPNLGYATYLDFSQASNNDLAPDAPLWGVYAENPKVVSEYLFETSGGGVFSFNISFEVELYLKILAALVGNSRHGYWSYQWVLAINENGPVYPLEGYQTGFTNSRYNSVTIAGKFDMTLTLQPLDRVYLYGIYICEDRGSNGNGLQASLDIHYSNISIIGQTLAPSTTTPFSLAFETAQALVNYNTGYLANIKSNLLGRTDIGYAADGSAALLGYTNGYQIRGFNQTVRPMQLTYKDWLSGLNAMYCVGQGYEFDAQGNNILRIEKAEYFYQDVEIIGFSEVSDYLEVIDSKYIFNSVEFGYEKFTQNLPSSQFTLDEYNTDHVLQTPIQSIRNALVQKSKQITSGYSIELTRREQFTDTPDDSWSYDEDIFVISCVRDGNAYKPESLENFNAGGVLGPASSYNFRLTPTRSLYRWAPFISSGLVYKKPSQILNNTYVSKNGDLISQYTGTDPLETTQVLDEGGDIPLANISKPLFFPAKITFKKRISWQVISLLRRCHQGQDNEGRNNGYISVVDTEGAVQQGYLIDLQYNAETELGSFTLRKKFVNLSVPFDCSVYSTNDFAQFEATTGLPAEIEECLFSNFE